MTEHATTVSVRRRSQLAVARALLFFFLFLGLEILFEHRHELGPHNSSCEAVHADETPWLYESIYPRLSRLLLQKPPSGKVAIVSIPKDLSEVQNVCRGRAYLATLIDLIRLQKPAAIVLDKYFSQGACGLDQTEIQESEALQTAVQKSMAENVQVIAGEATEPAGHEERGSCLVQTAEYRFFRTLDNNHYGLTKLNANREQLPLRWLVFGQRSSTQFGSEEQPQAQFVPPPIPMPRDSLALAAAKIVFPSALDNPHFRAVFLQPRQPYAQLDLTFNNVSTSELICRRGPNCGSASPADPSAYFAKGKLPFSVEKSVVIIGSQSSSDRWLVLGKRFWGYELQAAYLDALLSDRFLSAIPGSWTVGLSVIFLFFLEAIPAIGEYLHSEKRLHLPAAIRRPEFWLGIWSVIFFVLVAVFCVSQKYLPPLSVLLGVLVIVAARGLYYCMEYFQKHSVPDRKDLEP